MTDLEAKIYIAQVRTFYQDLLWYGIVNAVLVLIWLFFSASWYFWPGWVIVGWGLVMTRRAIMLDLISCKKIKGCVPFLNPDWEEKQIAKLTKQPPPSESSKKEKKGAE